MAARDRLPQEEIMNLLVNFFESCNEEIMGKETEGRGSTVNWSGRPLDGGVVGKGI